jgi:hypothetical protein
LNRGWLLLQLAVSGTKTSVKTDKAAEFGPTGIPDAVDERAQETSGIFGPLGIASQPEEIVGNPAW